MLVAHISELFVRDLALGWGGERCASVLGLNTWVQFPSLQL